MLHHATHLDWLLELRQSGLLGEAIVPACALERVDPVEGRSWRVLERGVPRRRVERLRPSSEPGEAHVRRPGGGGCAESVKPKPLGSRVAFQA